MSDITQITDYDERILPLVLEQYKDSPRLLSIIRGMNGQADDLEAALFELRDLFWLDTAEGNQLDMIGAIFGESRGGRSDADYRLAIKGASARRLSGTPEDIITALRAFTGATFVKYSRTGIADFTVETDGIFTDAQLDALCPAGVRGNAITPDRDFFKTLTPDEPLALLEGGFLYLIGG